MLCFILTLNLRVLLSNFYAASMPDEEAQEELQKTGDFTAKNFRQIQDLVKRMKRKTKPGYSHVEMLHASFKTFDVEEDGSLDEREFFKGSASNQ